MRAADPAMPPDRAMLDANVLLAATDEGRAEHDQALMIINDRPGRGAVLYISGQIMREYLAVATRPADRNGLGLALADALANVAAFRGRTSLLAEDGKVAGRLLALLGDVACGGKQIHDANVVATMLAHGIETIVTINTGSRGGPNACRGSLARSRSRRWWPRERRGWFRSHRRPAAAWAATATAAAKNFLKFTVIA